MAKLTIEFRAGNLYLPGLNLWLDPHEPKSDSSLVFVSHAHSDHTAAHREVILSAPTAKLMQARIPGARKEHVLNFGELRSFGQGDQAFSLTLLPAGHIFGSSMAFIQVPEQSLLYTGDFKLKPGLSAEPCEPKRADILIMETTYGRPQYVFPPAENVIKGVMRFCREALDNDETPVLLGYSLGKSQELLCGLSQAGFPLMLHGTIHKLTQIYEQFGQCFPKYEKYDAGTARGKVLLCPPNVANSSLLRKLGKTRSAILTGWAVDPNCRYRYQCDAAFPLSDHADFPDLLELVKRVRPKIVYTLHGFAADFANTLREQGFEAISLSQDEQLLLAVGGHGKVKRTNSVTPNTGPTNAPVEHGNVSTAITSSPTALPSTHTFLAFAQTCTQIAAVSGKLEKIRILAEYLKGLTGDLSRLAATWFTGRPFPASKNKVLQLGWAVLRDALCAVGNLDESAFHQIYLKHSDSGETAFELMQNRNRSATLTLEQVNGLFHKLQTARGPLAKKPLLQEAFELCTAVEVKFLVKIITGDLRIGLKEGLVEDAIATAAETSVDSVRQTNLLLGDIGETAKLAVENRLHEASLQPFRPIKSMLASPEETATDIWKRVSEWNPTPLNESIPPATTVWLEDKYDGIRCQFHKVGSRIALFSRDMKDITETFLELVDLVSKSTDDFILDGEIVAMRGEKILEFSELQKRLGRRQGDLFMRDEVPIQYVAFDLLWMAGKTFLNCPLRERRSQLEQLNPFPNCLRLARITQAVSEQEIESAFEAARLRGNEGLMIKDPASMYSPGRRGLAWLKLKKALATLDCVVVGAEFGHGKRSKVLSDYTFAVRDEQTGELKTIGKAYSGLTDIEIAQLTDHFLTTAVRQRGRFFEVKPDTVLEIAFDKIQPSARHASGLAMRFPRIVRIRTDKPVAEIDTLSAARNLAGLTKAPSNTQALD